MTGLILVGLLLFMISAFDKWPNQKRRQNYSSNNTTKLYYPKMKEFRYYKVIAGLTK